QTQSFTLPGLAFSKRNLNQKKARLWCIAPLPRNRFHCLPCLAEKFCANARFLKADGDIAHVSVAYRRGAKRAV
ncbi:MAG: hypothetical protein E6559_08600, partial [Pantoea sp.]|nr:hypothetical protein [Pantoea sp.]